MTAIIPVILQVPEVTEIEDPGSAQVTILQDHSQPGSGCPEAVKVVGSLNGFPEWEEYFDSGTRFYNGV